MSYILQTMFQFLFPFQSFPRAPLTTYLISPLLGFPVGSLFPLLTIPHDIYPF